MRELRTQAAAQSCARELLLGAGNIHCTRGLELELRTRAAAGCCTHRQLAAAGGCMGAAHMGSCRELHTWVARGVSARGQQLGAVYVRSSKDLHKWAVVGSRATEQ